MRNITNIYASIYTRCIPFQRPVYEHAIAGHVGIHMSRFHYAASREPELSLFCIASHCCFIFFISCVIHYFKSGQSCLSSGYENVSHPQKGFAPLSFNPPPHMMYFFYIFNMPKKSKTGRFLAIFFEKPQAIFFAILITQSKALRYQNKYDVSPALPDSVPA